MSTLLKRFTSNASANIVGGLGTALYNLVLPSLVVHKLNADDFSIWSLGLQVMIYVQVLGFGVQTVLARFIAVDNECENKYSLYLTVFIGRDLVKKMMLAGMLFSLFLIFFYPMFFRGLSLDKINTLRYCVVAFGISASIQLLSLLPIGYFTGIHKNYIHVSCQLLGRMVSLLVVYYLTTTDVSIKCLAIGLSLSLLIYVILLTFFMIRKIKFPYRTEYNKNEISERKNKIKSQCKLLAIWSLCMLCVNGLQTPIVGLYDIKMVGIYSLAYTLVLVITGLFQSTLSPLITNGSSLHAKNETEKLCKLLYVASLVVFVLGFILLVGITCFGDFLLKFWIGPDKANDVYGVFLILAISFIIRNMASPYAMLLIATGAHKNASTPAIIEGVTSVLGSMLLGHFYGVKGVAFGVYFSAMIGLFFNFSYTKNNLFFLQRTRKIFFILFFLVPIPIYSSFIIF